MRMVHVYDWINETCYRKRFECSNSVERCYRITNPQVFLSFFFKQTDIQLFVNRLDSVESVLPYEYDV